MKRRIAILAVLTSMLILFWPSSVWCASRGLTVYVIAPSVSTSMEARAIIRNNGWSETTDVRTADAILVVVRSSLLNPLNYTYDSVKELADDAENQLNISGPKFHVYLFQMQSDSSVYQIKHISYEAE